MGWVKTAAMKASSFMSAAAPMPMANIMGMMGMPQVMPQKSQVAKLIGEFNKRGVTTEPIKYNDVVEVMSMRSDSKISKILSELEERKDEVRDPTAWVKTAAKKAPKGMPQKSPVARLIGEFNKREVTQPIRYDDVAEVMSQLSEAKISKILSELEEKADTVRDPTAWVKVAATKAPKSMPMMPMMQMLPMMQMSGLRP